MRSTKVLNVLRSYIFISAFPYLLKISENFIISLLSSIFYYNVSKNIFNQKRNGTLPFKWYFHTSWTCSIGSKETRYGFEFSEIGLRSSETLGAMNRSLHKKRSFPLRISSVNVTKSAGNWRNNWWKTSFFLQSILYCP